MDETEQKKIFASNLTRYINMSGKTQKEIAKELDVNYTTLNTWCTGNAMPKVSMIQKIADHFKIGKSDLVDDPSQKPKVPEYSHDHIELIKLYSGLTDDQKKSVMSLLRSFYN